MSMVKGKVGDTTLSFLSAPKGEKGKVVVQIPGQENIQVSWIADEQGIWLELPQGVYGFDIRMSQRDDSLSSFELLRRGGNDSWDSISFRKQGEQELTSLGETQKKQARVRAQMPGKIVRVLTTEGAAVQKDQPLIVMEAMKMENEIRASQAGRVGKINVSAGQTVETGFELMIIDVT